MTIHSELRPSPPAEGAAVAPPAVSLQRDRAPHPRPAAPASSPQDKASPVLSRNGTPLIIPVIGRKCRWDGCGKILIQRAGEKTTNFNIRKTCSRECATLLRNTTEWRRKVGRNSDAVKPAAPDVWARAFADLTQRYEDDPRAVRDRGSPGTQAQLVPHFGSLISSSAALCVSGGGGSTGRRAAAGIGNR